MFEHPYVRMDTLAVGDVIRWNVNTFTVLSIEPKPQRKGANPRLTITYEHHLTKAVITNVFLTTAKCLLIKKAAQNG